MSNVKSLKEVDQPTQKKMILSYLIKGLDSLWQDFICDGTSIKDAAHHHENIKRIKDNLEYNLEMLENKKGKWTFEITFEEMI